ncbi:MAG: hypothetical protein O3B84_00645 [Chloroflexi bacterium]|nr:hypothetical protein [Chloroflexota bacterium]
MDDTRGPGGGRRRQRGKPAQRQREISPSARRALAGAGALFAVILLVLALGLSGLVLPAAINAVLDFNVPLLVGAAAIIATAAAGVAIAGTSMFKGIPFHALGVLGPYYFGSTFESFQAISAIGPVLYLATWCWGLLGETVFGLIKARRTLPPVP